MTHKLLLADDSVTIQKVVELILAEEDFEIKSVSSGEDAVAALAGFKPDIILADIEMPKINGYQLCEMIKQDPSTGNIPVILLTGAFEPIDEELAKQVRADDFIVKPFESQDLISKLNAALTVSAVAEVAPEEAEAIVEAEAMGIEEPSIITEEDLWSMEETIEATEVTGLAAEEPVAAGIEEMLELAEELPEEVEAKETGIAPPPSEEKVTYAGVQMELPERDLPSKDEFKAIFEKTVNDKVASFLASLEVKETLLTSLTPAIKDSVEKILWEVTPDLVERMLKEMLKGSLESLAKEVEKVIWETVPDLAETMITKEIERIRSEF